ncbi:AAA family ATPase [Nonomuraea basaltis]|uniref:nucleotide-binding protein n=1 Tax=Nonomuraea basaltis TaxID=2495887 RepID=UPI00110C615F|nr:AAA family ATPase [Nonomuraea basaltis]TMR98828.1 MinD/ParA family protein [Nonomuraea basaltis]
MADQEDRHDESQLGKEDYHLLLEAVRLVPGLETAAQFTKLAMRKLTFPLNSPEDLRPLFDGVDGTISGTKQEIPISHLYKHIPSQMFPITSYTDLIGVALKPRPRKEPGETDDGTTGDSAEPEALKATAKPNAEPAEQAHASAEVAEPSTTRTDSDLTLVQPSATEVGELAPVGADHDGDRITDGSPNGSAEKKHANVVVEDAELITVGEASGEEKDDMASQPALEDEAVASNGNAPSAFKQEIPSAPEQETPSAPQESPSAEDSGTAEPARAQYQARQKAAPRPGFSTASRQGGSSIASLDAASLLKSRSDVPTHGWRKLIYKVSGGLIKPRESSEMRHRRELIARARTRVSSGHHRVAVLSLKGGVGKTTTTACLGSILAQVRGDRVIAIDANPDRGTLSDKIQLETPATVRDLLNERDRIQRYVDIRTFTSQAPSRLEILASDRDPSVSEAFTASDYQAVSAILENFYSICITDCGTGLLHSAMSGVLGLADQLVLVTSPAVDCARATSATLDWLVNHKNESLVRSATVVLCSVRPRSKSTVDLDQLEAHFAAHCRAVIRVPYDPHLEEGAEVDLERLQPRTHEAFLHLAASVGDGFADPQP